jgi:perosamine synthetase
VEAPWARHAYWLYTVVLGGDVAVERDAVMGGLAAVGIETRPVFYPMHVMEPYYEGRGRYPVAERLSERGLSLPTHVGMKREDVVYVAAKLRRLCGL